MNNCDINVYLYILLVGLIAVDCHFEDPHAIFKRSRHTTDLKCTLPQHPADGRWLVINGDGKPGDSVDVNTILKFECRDGYRLNPMIPFVACDTDWDPTKFPKCEKKCPAFFSTATTSLKCIDRDGNKIACDQAIDGTYLTFQCIAYYEPPPGTKRSLFCRDGIWDFPKPLCQPVCGKKINNETKALSFGGREVRNMEYPWVIALYKQQGGKFQNICGGTLISRRVILTAAHCVTNENGIALSKENFIVASGKYYNEYNDSRDEWAQYREIAKLIVNDGYRGESQRYAADIAIIVVNKLFGLGPVVQPICFNNVNTIYLNSKDIGEVAGWGLTEENSVADRLKVIKIPFKDKGTCSQELPEEWEEKYFFFDKICAGQFRKNVSVCKGDSGNGLIFRNKEDSRYYIHGIVSIAPNLDNAPCNYETNALYTSVSYYYSFIDREINKYFLEDCVLPPYPANGKWELQTEDDKSPGEIVTSKSILKYSCNKGYKLSSSNVLFACGNTNDPPTCNLLCPALEFPVNTFTSCKNRKNEVISCSEATDGSSVTYSCTPGFETDRRTRTSTRYCINGSYGSPKPDCILPAVSQPSVITSPTTRENETKVICTYVSWWAYHGVYPEDFDPTLCTHVIYNFIGLWDKGDVRVQNDELDLDQEERGLYNRVTDLKKKNKNLKVLLSVGGTGASNSTLFTQISKHAGKTGSFLGSASHFIKTYHFDGLDIDWQYPEESDKENYIQFLQTIREEFDRNGWLLSATVRSDFENTGYNVSAMTTLLDWVSINTIDFYGSWSSYTGNHNSLFPSSKEYVWEKNHLNMDAVAKNWLSAGLSKNKLVLTIAFYGKSFTLKNKNDHGVHAPITGKGPGEDDGVIRYYELCSQYKDNFKEVWDDETKTPYKYNDTTWIGYNSKDAVKIKSTYVKKNGYAGVNVYPWDGDDNKGICGTKYILLKHIHEGLRNQVDWDK